MPRSGLWNGRQKPERLRAVANARLVTISISHFCEKARWALDRAGIPYDEERHIQFAHILASKRAGGKGTTPVLVTTTGGVLTESADIVRWSDASLYPS